jgi:hypothetical protein
MSRNISIYLVEVPSANDVKKTGNFFIADGDAIDRWQ